MGLFDSIGAVVTNPGKAIDALKDPMHLLNPSLTAPISLLTGKSPSEMAQDAFGGGDVPEGRTVPIDEKTRGLISDISERGRLDPAQLQREQMAGVDMATGGLMPKANTGLGGESSAFSQAILNKTQGLTNERLAGLRSASENMAIQNKFRNVQRGFAARLNAENVYTDALRKQMEAQDAKDAARAGAIGSVLGLVGTGVGAYFGGPAGAAAGGSIGSGVGTAYGRQKG